MSNFNHIPVLLNEAVDALNVLSNKKYIDATLGGGGHTGSILQKGGIVLGIDQDDEALSYVDDRLKKKIEEKRLFIAKGNFKDIKKLALGKGFDKVDGILFDLGVSSHQFDDPKRGFSFKSNEKLDMRMDKGSPLSAHDVVNKYSFEKLVDIFIRYGEEHNAKDIAIRIVDERKRNPIETAHQLASLIEKVSHKPEGIHPATRVFQAIRIEVNDEINVLKEALDKSLDLLEKGGRLAVISFHSLEDRIVKQTFLRLERQNLGKVISKKPLTATFIEQKKNRRSRSAKLRVFEKL